MGESIFKGQSELTIRVSCTLDLTTATLAVIKYKKPDGTSGSWNATIADAAGGIIEHLVTSGTELDQAGIWLVWAYITFADAHTAPGETAEMLVCDEGFIV